MQIAQPTLTDQEWMLVLDLLHQEQDELPVERRHSDSAAYSNMLDQRRGMVDDLIRRLQSQGRSD